MAERNRELLSIEAQSLGYCYGKHQALTDVSFALGTGLHSVLGPNGAGKSTLLNLLAGLTKAGSGALVMGGQPVKTAQDRSRWREQIGYLPQSPKWSAPMKASAFLEYFGRLRGLDRAQSILRAEQCLAQVGLAKSASKQMNALSGGQLKRLYVAQALLHDPLLLILDEPTAGLDPLARVELRELVSQMRYDRIVIMATHLIEDVTHLSSQVLVLDEGVLTWQGSAADLGGITANSDAATTRLGSAEEIGFIELFSRPAAHGHERD